MLAGVRVFFWLFAILGNLAAIGIVSLGVKAIDVAGGPMDALGSTMGGGLVLIYAVAFSLVPTCLAISVDGLTRS